MRENILKTPVVALRGMVVFPDLVAHLDIGREKSLKAVEEAMANDRMLVVVSQRDDSTDDPNLDELHKVGTLVKIKQLLRLPGGIVRILVTGISRVELLELAEEDTHFVVLSKMLETVIIDDIEIEAYRRLVNSKFEAWNKELKAVPEEALQRIERMSDAEKQADYIASLLPINVKAQQELLEELSLASRLNKIIAILNVEMEIADLENSLNHQVRQQMEKSQKEYFLREKIKVIHDELGDHVNQETEAEEFRKTLSNLSVSKDIRQRIEKEIRRFERMPQMMPESTIVRNYLEWVLGLPWNQYSEDRLDINEAARILDEDHFGLEKVKERILEFLSVHHLTESQSGSILCFVGPPGVGKTSLAASIAKAMNRKFVRASLGGMRDEAEIRGHRRTYIGSMPGRMIQGIKNAGTNNPVFLLDEIDKLASDYKGDPSSALLEVLDPEQNNSFSDNFIELPYDFSKVFWITTANVISDIPRPLLDRMEVITLSGYTAEEKLEIAKTYLVPKQAKKHGLKESVVKLSDGVLKKLIQDYTREAGVRGLEKVIAKVCRKIACQVVKDPNYKVKVTTKTVEELLGPAKYKELEKEKRPQVGLACGLAWTSVGGVVLPCEAMALKGRGKLLLTGSLGNVMKESAQAALTYIRHNAKALKLEDDFYEKYDLHVHLPEGATPKDGPSAGITMTLAMVSALTERKVRSDIAMTGEITIRGQVLPIGGLKEKVLAAHRHGIKEVIIPEGNKKDLTEIPESVRDLLTITPVKTMNEVLVRSSL